jgi:hypothetical protein
MIHSSVGGTAAELWTSLSGLQKEPSLHGYVDTFSLALKNYQGGAEKYAQEQDDYQARLTKWSATEGKAYGAALNAWKAANKANEAEGKPAAPMPTPAVPKPKPPVDPVGKKPTVLFNGKIAPLIPYAIKGVIWYQGESNNQKPFEYRTLFPRLIADWREKWGQGDFPFLFVQIAPYKFDIPELRETQFLTWKKTATPPWPSPWTWATLRTSIRGKRNRSASVSRWRRGRWPMAKKSNTPARNMRRSSSKATGPSLPSSMSATVWWPRTAR